MTAMSAIQKTMTEGYCLPWIKMRTIKTSTPAAAIWESYLSA